MNKKIEKQFYVCRCGRLTWKIRDGGIIECDECGAVYQMRVFPLPEQAGSFNRDRTYRELAIKFIEGKPVRTE